MVALIWVGQDEVLGSEIALQAVSGHQTGDKDVFCGPLSTVGTKREAEDEGSRFLSSLRMDSLTRISLTEPMAPPTMTRVAVEKSWINGGVKLRNMAARELGMACAIQATIT